MAKPSSDSIDDNALLFEGALFSEEMFKRCVMLAVRDILSNASMTPNKISNETNLDGSFLRLVANGKKSIGLFTLFKIASGCGIEPEEFVKTISVYLREEIKGRGGK